MTRKYLLRLGDGQEVADGTDPTRASSVDSDHDGLTDFLEERIGTPLRSRLYEMCKKVMIEGEDFRKRLDQRRSDSARV